jgi:hypothetical protein
MDSAKPFHVITGKIFFIGNKLRILLKLFVIYKNFSSADMQYIDIRGTTQENIAKEVEEIAKRRGMELEFQVNLSYH